MSQLGIWIIQHSPLPSPCPTSTPVCFKCAKNMGAFEYIRINILHALANDRSISDPQNVQRSIDPPIAIIRWGFSVLASVF